MYVRVPPPLRNVEDLLAESGIDLCHEMVRHWWNRFGPRLAGKVRRQRVSAMRGFRHRRLHLDEMCVKLAGEMVAPGLYRVERGDAAREYESSRPVAVVLLEFTVVYA